MNLSVVTLAGQQLPRNACAESTGRALRSPIPAVSPLIKVYPGTIQSMMPWDSNGLDHSKLPY
ncbi:uncharacterized protein BCR38DRAFT_179342 [Pseudomassariella vexata]|uniref:Uncharacterized protein n=1 Tax=Pseudomassariella vexata TaxID=1141098 RepID=A0A1Y2E4F2_9PEZI|nr:uncharacterized protein BCR38DRAFT_179342 [Pseudomassariella vexata]ORY66402.1 hypothetical protein BCR38DRAFT_179342 [Pseudomassariella vexata]